VNRSATLRPTKADPPNAHQPPGKRHQVHQTRRDHSGRLFGSKDMVASYGCRFRIKDTGSGIAAEEQEKLFQPFSQAKKSLNTQEGTGLGLAISREYARLMGGDCHADQQRGPWLDVPV